MGWRNTTLTILSGATESEELNLRENGARRIKNFSIIAPTTLTGVVVVHLADLVGGTYKALNDGFGNDKILLQNKAEQMTAIAAGAMKLVSSGAEAADRVFIVQGAVQK